MRKIALAIPVYQSIPSVFFSTFINLIFYMLQKYELRVLVTDNTYLPLARNKLIDNFLSTDCEYLFFLDSDMSIQPDFIDKLLAMDKDVASALYFLRNRLTPAYKFHKDGKYQDPTDYPENSIIEVDSIGLGCALIKRNVIETIHKSIGEKPFVDIHFNTRNDVIGDDTFFCNLVRENGFKIFVNTGLIAGHFGATIDEKYFKSRK